MATSGKNAAKFFEEGSKNTSTKNTKKTKTLSINSLSNEDPTFFAFLFINASSFPNLKVFGIFFFFFLFACR